MRVLLLLIGGGLVALGLDGFVDLSFCEYDACRYLTTRAEDLQFGQPQFATKVMHALYWTDADYPFVRAFSINAGFLLALSPLLKLNNAIFRSPLALALAVLPGKEFFLMLAVGCVAAAYDGKNSARWLVAIACAVLLALIARPPMVMIGAVALLLRDLWVSRRWILTVLVCLATFVLGLVLSELMGRSGPGEGFDVEASVGLAGVIRERTADIALAPVLARTVVYCGYLLLLPVVEIGRFVYGIAGTGLMPYHVFLLGACAEWARHIVNPTYRNGAGVCVVISAFVVALTFSFVHTRYLLPFFLLLSLVPAPLFRAPRVSFGVRAVTAP